jgi:AcrR family transcriptional regulator
MAEPVTVRRPTRADARRNFDALLTAARDAFGEDGAAASLEDVARRAGVGIGTLYRHFPTRQALFEAVYVGEIEELVRVAGEVAERPAWDALLAWLRQFADYLVTKRAIAVELDRQSEVMRACREAMFAAGVPLLERAQAAGEVRTDLTFDDLIRLIAGVTSSGSTDDAQRERLLTVALDGIRPRG